MHLKLVAQLPLVFGSSGSGTGGRHALQGRRDCVYRTRLCIRPGARRPAGRLLEYADYHGHGRSGQCTRCIALSNINTFEFETNSIRTSTVAHRQNMPAPISIMKVAAASSLRENKLIADDGAEFV